MTNFEPARISGSHEAAGRRAAEFFERRQFGGWSDSDQAELDAWLADSPLHRVAYLRVEWNFSRAERLAAQSLKPEITTALEPIGKSRLPRFVLPMLAAASAALFAMVSLPMLTRWMQPPDRVYSTELGGRTLLNFADHTQVELDTDTIARFRMTNTERTVWLEKGEAWFHVAHNAANPFSVIVGRHRVSDLGTEFLVRRNADGMEVALLSGRADLSTEGAPNAVLRPGEDAVATGAALSVVRKTPQELADELAWRRGILVFRSTRLVDAVEEFNRYNRTKLVIADPTIADLRVTAEIRDDNFEGFLHVAETMLGLHADRQGNDILLSREMRQGSKKGVRTQRSRVGTP